MLCFFFDFWVPRTPTKQSKVWNCQQKTYFGEVRKKVPPKTQILPYSQARRLPGQPPYVFDCLDKKQQFGPETATVAHFWVHLWILVLESVISESMFGKLLFFRWNLKTIWKKKAHSLQKLLCVVPVQRLVIWHALLKQLLKHMS